MATNNPTYTAADVITDVNNRFVGGSNLDSTVLLPWVSYSYLKLYNAIISVGQRAKEEIFGDRGDITLSSGTLEYTITDSLPRFGGILKVEVRYGDSEDDWVPAKPLVSITHWKSLDNVSTTYRSKTDPLYYLRRSVIGIIPTPTAGEDDQTPTARVWFIRRPYKIDATTDEIDIPYRFIYPVINYVYAMAVRRVNEDHQEASLIEQQFERELEEVALMVANEFEEGVDGVEAPSDSELYHNPLSY